MRGIVLKQFEGLCFLYRPWGDTPRRNQLIFIGRNLDEEGMRKGFDECLV